MENIQTDIQTDSGTVEPLKQASLERRLIAMMVDQAIIGLIVGIPFAYMLMNQISEAPDLVRMNFVILVAVFIILLLKDCYGGRSIGKRLAGIRVVLQENPESTPSLPALMIRNASLAIWPVELFYLLKGKHSLRLGDRYAKTIVVMEREKLMIKTMVVVFIVTSFLFASCFIKALISFILNDPSYLLAIDTISHNQEILKEVGSIKSFGSFPSASIEYSGDEGQGYYGITVIGTKKTVTIYVYMERHKGIWTVVELQGE